MCQSPFANILYINLSGCQHRHVRSAPRLYRAGRPVMTQRGLAGGAGAFCGCSSGGGSMFAISNNICARTDRETELEACGHN